MHTKDPRRRGPYLLWLLLLAALTLSGCQSAPAAGVPVSAGSQAGSLPSLKAVFQESNKPAVPDTWGETRATAGGMTYSFRYPRGWNADLSYCVPGAAPQPGTGSHLHAGCASTDLLIGRKAQDVGVIRGEAISIDGKRALKEVDTGPRNVNIAGRYTVMLYDAAGAPLLGFSTFVGHGTSASDMKSIFATLDMVAGTFDVEGRP